MNKCKILELDKCKGSSDIYEHIWGSRKNAAFTKKRNIEFLKLLYPEISMRTMLENGMIPGSPMEFAEDLILDNLEKNSSLKKSFDLAIDFGSGLGAYSTAALELKLAKRILMLDGSKKALETYESRLMKTKDLMLEPQEIISKVTKCHLNLNRLDSLLEYVGHNKADLVFSRYVLMHTANPFLAIYNMTRLCKLNGIIAFNIFLPPAVPPVVRAERTFVKTLPLEIKLQVLGALGKLESVEKTCTIEDFLQRRALVSSAYDELRYFYNEYMIPEFGIDLVKKHCFHLENSTTPYIHTPSEERLKFFLGDIMRLESISQPITTRSHMHSEKTEYWGVFKTTKETIEIKEEQVPTIEFEW